MTRRPPCPGLRYAVLTAVMALATLAAISTAWAAADAPFEAAFQDFQRGSTGDSAATDRAFDEFDALLKAEPANPVLMAYAGAATALKAGAALLR